MPTVCQALLRGASIQIAHVSNLPAVVHLPYQHTGHPVSVIVPQCGSSKITDFVKLAVPFYFFRGDVEDLSILHDILLGNFPRFSAHRSLKISEQYFAIFFKGYISQTKLNSDAINYVACESLGKAQFYRDHVKEEL